MASEQVELFDLASKDGKYVLSNAELNCMECLSLTMSQRLLEFESMVRRYPQRLEI